MDGNANQTTDWRGGIDLNIYPSWDNNTTLPTGTLLYLMPTLNGHSETFWRREESRRENGYQGFIWRPLGGFVTRRAIVWTWKELGYDGGWLLRLALTIMITKYNDFFPKTKLLSTFLQHQSMSRDG